MSPSPRWCLKIACFVRPKAPNLKIFNLLSCVKEKQKPLTFKKPDPDNVWSEKWLKQLISYQTVAVELPTVAAPHYLLTGCCNLRKTHDLLWQLMPALMSCHTRLLKTNKWVSHTVGLSACIQQDKIVYHGAVCTLFFFFVHFLFSIFQLACSFLVNLIFTRPLLYTVCLKLPSSFWIPLDNQPPGHVFV